MRESRREHWEAFWAETSRISLEDVYDNGGRILREIFSQLRPDGDLTGLRVLEVGAGSGRDSLALSDAGELNLVHYSAASAASLTNTACPLAWPS